MSTAHERAKLRATLVQKIERANDHRAWALRGAHYEQQQAAGKPDGLDKARHIEAARNYYDLAHSLDTLIQSLDHQRKALS